MDAGAHFRGVGPIVRLRIAATISSSVKSGCWATRASSAFACSSNRDLLPPVGFALALPVSRHRCNHFTAKLGHRLNLSAASRRDAPASTASITRSRNHQNMASALLGPPKDEAVHQTRPPTRCWESLRLSGRSRQTRSAAGGNIRETRQELHPSMLHATESLRPDAMPACFDQSTRTRPAQFRTVQSRPAPSRLASLRHNVASARRA
jgi:hypothetical protein